MPCSSRTPVSRNVTPVFLGEIVSRLFAERKREAQRTPYRPCTPSSKRRSVCAWVRREPVVRGAIGVECRLIPGAMPLNWKRKVGESSVEMDSMRAMRIFGGNECCAPSRLCLYSLLIDRYARTDQKMI